MMTRRSTDVVLQGRYWLLEFKQTENWWLWWFSVWEDAASKSNSYINLFNLIYIRHNEHWYSWSSMWLQSQHTWGWSHMFNNWYDKFWVLTALIAAVRTDSFLHTDQHITTVRYRSKSCCECWKKKTLLV